MRGRSGASEVKVAKDEYIIKQGDEGNHFYVVRTERRGASSRARLWRRTPSGAAARARTRSPPAAAAAAAARPPRAHRAPPTRTRNPGRLRLLRLLCEAER